MNNPQEMIQCQKCGKVMKHRYWGVHRAACDRKVAW